MTQPERRTFILDKLRVALKAILGDPRYDWTRTNDNICDAASTMMERVQDFIEGKCGETTVKPLYKQWVSLHPKEING